MPLDANARRRWFGALNLLAALTMLICGETVFEGKLKGLAFVSYWMLCLVLTGVALLVAILDARALQRRTRKEHHDLFETTLRQIERDAQARPPDRDRKRGKR